MGLSQALSSGISGLVTHQQAMDNVGNNLANVNTYGFKKGVFQFRTLLEQTFRGGMGADAQTGRGSINPVSLGLGTQTGSINKVFTQGNLEVTGNPNDMAISGNGFFVLGTGNGYVYTRDGSFYLGADGSLMGNNGLYVQGTMAQKNADGSISIPQDARLENVIIPIGTTGGMSQTSKVEFKGNLDSTQQLSTGLKLFGTNAPPTISDLQKWMSAQFDSKDSTWTALETPSYVISQATLDAIKQQYGISLPTNLANNVRVYSGGPAVDVAAGLTADTAYYAVNRNTGQVEAVYTVMNPGTPQEYKVPANVSDLINGVYNPGVSYIPVVEEVKEINGGNVQTSAAYAISTPAFLAQNSKVFYGGQWVTINNAHTYPSWFYDDNGGDFISAAAVPETDYTGGLATPATIDAGIRAGWPGSAGFPGKNWPASPALVTLNDLPRIGETFAAGLNTPLENLMYLKGNVWTTPFANIKNGDEITVSFKKGHSQVEAKFTYNKPVIPANYNPLLPPQQPLNIAQSYTLENFLQFLAGDVDDPGSACTAITPAMFGAIPDADYPDGNPTNPPSINFDRNAYENALANVSLATGDANKDLVGGVMGLLSIPPKISANNGGPDAYDSPIETAGAFTREGVSSKTPYQRWDSTLNQFVKIDGSSFNVSLVSNLGLENALSDIRVTYNNVPHESMFSAETQYSAPQGGSAVASMQFYDSLGNPKTATVRLAMVSQDSDFTTWRWYADCPDDTDFPWQCDPNTGEIISNLSIGTGLIRFDKNGNFVKGAELSESQGITINQLNQGVNEPIWIKLFDGQSADIPQDLDFSFLTFSAAKNDFTLKSQNGAPPGTLDSYQVSLDGLIQGVFSNGVVAPIARLILALIPNMNGMVAAGNNLFFTGPASGDAQYGYANLGSRGEIVQNQLETSNVDLATEFTKLITVERGFQANSRTITTADEMLQELMNLKR